jgi:nucleoid-associated protein YgaU
MESVMSQRVGPPNPKRVAAGKINAMKRVGFSEEGLAKVRAAALINRPWLYSTGPRTAEGKARSSANGRSKQIGDRSAREVRREIAVALGSGAAIARTCSALIAARHDS